MLNTRVFCTKDSFVPFRGGTGGGEDDDDFELWEAPNWNTDDWLFSNSKAKRNFQGQLHTYNLDEENKFTVV